MKKFDIAYTDTRRMVIAIEANTEQEAKDLFVKKLQNDDGFCDEIEERLENGIIDEEVYAYDIDDDEIVDYTYEEMNGSDEE